MRVLMTGCTGLQCGKPTRLQILCSTDLLAKELRTLEHVTFEHRVTIPGEDLSMYDKVFVGIAPFSSWSSPFIYGALWAMTTGKNVTTHVDDWQCHGYRRGFEQLSTKDPDTFFSRVSGNGVEMVGKDNKEEALKVRSNIEEGIRLLGTKMPFPMLVPLYQFGNIDLLDLSSNSPIKYDPSEGFEGYLKGVAGVPKERKWMSAQITASDSFQKKLRLSWPMQNFGRKKNKEERMTEPELAHVYHKTWGNLCPPHIHTKEGSGWWRVRFIMSYESGSIMIGHPGEMSPWGRSYCKSSREVEAMSDDELHKLAYAQKEDYEKTVWPLQRFKEFVRGLL